MNQAQYRSDNVLFELIGDRTMLFVHNREKMTGEDASAVRAIYRQLGDALSEYRALIVTDGGAPSREQRSAVQREFGTAIATIRTALVTDATALRIVVATLSLVVKTMKTFSGTQLEAAIHFLELSDDDAAQVRQRVKAIATQVPPGRFTTFEAIAAPLKPNA